jgi:hypothetical protein
MCGLLNLASLKASTLHPVALSKPRHPVNSQQIGGGDHVSDKVQEQRKTDATDNESDPASDSRLDFNLPIAASSPTKPIEFAERDIERCSTHAPK